jgi:hypothetical protein
MDPTIPKGTPSYAGMAFFPNVSKNFFGKSMGIESVFHFPVIYDFL